MADTRQISLTVNGESYVGEVETRMHLADFLRQSTGLTGTHLGCEHGVCGACTVIVDGDAVRSCLMLAVQANDTSITTIEGLAEGGEDFFCLLPIHDLSLEVLLFGDDFYHLLFDGRQILLGEAALRSVEIVVKPIFDRWSDCHHRTGKKALHRISHDVGG